MQFAKPRQRQHPRAAVVREATLDDRTAVEKLINRAIFAHHHADWRSSAHWIGAAGSVVYWRNNTPQAYLAATADPPPTAWIRTLAIDKADVQQALESLLPPALDRLSTVGVNKVACMTAADWLNRVLPVVQFELEEQVNTLIKRTWQHPLHRMTNLVIKPAAASDFELLAAIDQKAFANPLWWHSSGQLQQAAWQALQFDVAWIDDTVVGYIYAVRTARRQAHIVRVAVVPAYQGRSLGSALLSNALDFYRHQGITVVTLNTQSHNKVAQRLYERFGFEATGEMYPVWTRSLVDRKEISYGNEAIGAAN